MFSLSLSMKYLMYGITITSVRLVMPLNDVTKGMNRSGTIIIPKLLSNIQVTSVMTFPWITT